MKYSPLVYIGMFSLLLVLMLLFFMSQSQNTQSPQAPQDISSPVTETDVDDNRVNTAAMSTTSTKTKEQSDIVETDETARMTSTNDTDSQNVTAFEPQPDPILPEVPEGKAVAILAGGCFWCVESDMEKIPAVSEAISGYMGGTTENPTYENYSKGGHREVVKVIYDPSVASYADLVQQLLRHIDPTDGAGSFGDRGLQYASAVYYTTTEERTTAERIIRELDTSNRFEKSLQVPVLPTQTFYSAEDYHQDYAKEHVIKYTFYRSASGRDRFIDKHWTEAEKTYFEDVQNLSPESPTVLARVEGDWETFEKPSEDVLKEMLTPISYKVTQKDGTEKAFDNEYWDNKEEGIYVDILSGEPLFSSVHKYVSGTGWPSFTQPIIYDAVTEHEDRKLFVTRTEIRSKHGDNHLGHVFDDGPTEKGGLRYCMNSAALRFIPKDELAGTVYEPYLQLFEE